MPRTPTATARRQARTALDARLGLARASAAALVVPRGGWIRNIRSALGLPAADLAKRLGISTSSVLRMEMSEAQESIRLSTLRRVADELGCDLVYAFVPREDLATTVHRQARKRAVADLAPVQHTMSLEAQSVSDALSQSLLETETAAWQSRAGLWDE